MADEWDAKAREIVACPEVPDGTAHDRFCPFGWNNCRRSAACEMREDLAAAMHAIDTAAYQRGIERAAKACNLVGDDWRDAGIELKAFAADYLAAYIRALPTTAETGKEA